MSKKSYRDNVERAEKSLKNNPNHFWKFINNKHSNNGIPKVMSLNGITSSNAQESANIFVNYFSSVCSTKSIDVAVDKLGISSFDLPNTIDFNVDDVFNSLSTLLGV